MPDTVVLNGTFVKSDADQRRVLGWAYLVKNADGSQVVDHSGDVMEDVQALEDSVAEFVSTSRAGDDMHSQPVVAKLIGSLVVTPEKLAALGAPAGSLPTGWLTEWQVTDDATWQKIKSGERSMLSIAGAGDREPINA